jgi:hypothetical protein
MADGHVYLLRRQADGAVKIGFAQIVTADPDYMSGCDRNSGVRLVACYPARAGAERELKQGLVAADDDGWFHDSPEVDAVLKDVGRMVSGWRARRAAPATVN